jgi:hypothetical protein
VEQVDTLWQPNNDVDVDEVEAAEKNIRHLSQHPKILHFLMGRSCATPSTWSDF